MYFFKIKKRYPCGEGIYGKGQITVFMALTMTIIFSVILTAVESARVNTVSLLAQTASELAVESALAEYNIPLYEMYGIFAIDGNREDFTKDILSYARKNEGKGFFKFEAKQAYMAETKMLYEMDYKLLEKEIVQYMKIRAPGAWLDEMTDTDNDLLDKAQNNKEILEENIASENAAAKYQESQEGGNAPSEPPLDDVKDGRLEGGTENKKGLLYEDYLRILLTFTGRKKKYERMENLMQANIRLAEGYENFNIRRCYYGMTCLFEYAVPSYFTVYTRYKGNYTMNNQWSECY